MQLASAASQVAESAAQVEKSSSDQSDAASATAAGVEQVTVSVHHIADTAKEAEAMFPSYRFALRWITFVSPRFVLDQFRVHTKFIYANQLFTCNLYSWKWGERVIESALCAVYRGVAGCVEC